jgi:hypothetical protein
MSWQRPSPAAVFEAVDAYLRVVYGSASAPSAVRDRVATLRAAPPEELFDSPVLERAGGSAAAPDRYSLRLGNRFYPHMKLVIERSPDGRGFLFRADTHDRHVRPPPGSRDAAAFAELARMNQKAAEEVEAEWARLGLPTFKEYLRQDLAKRAAGAASPT